MGLVMETVSDRLMRIVVLLGGLGAAACNLSAFDDRRRSAWSDSSGRPSPVTSSDYGTVITTVDREQPGATIVVAGNDPPSISTVSYDDRGARTARGADLLDVAGGIALAGALDPIVGGDGVVAIAGSGASGEILFYDARSGVTGPAPRGRLAAGACGALAGPGQAMVFGLTGAGVAEEPDLIVLAGTELLVLPDVDVDSPGDCWRCTLTDAAVEPVSGLQVAVTDAGGPDGEEIVVLVDRSSTAPAALLLLAAPTVLDGGPCVPLGAPTPLDRDERLAPVMGVGDVDGDQAPDVALVASTLDRAYVVRDLDASGASGGTQLIVPPAGSVQFGTALAFGDFDGDDAEELAIGDPAASSAADPGVDGGRVTVYRFDTEDGLVPEATLYDGQPEPGQAFGRVLGVAEFVAGGIKRDLLIVGARGEVFTYFRLLDAIDDPRE